MASSDFTVTIAKGQLVAPVTPKLADDDNERVRVQLVQKITELQTIVRAIAATNPAIVAALHIAGVAGF